MENEGDYLDAWMGEFPKLNYREQEQNPTYTRYERGKHKCYRCDKMNPGRMVGDIPVCDPCIGIPVRQK
jgi:hypothetical protein